MKYNININQSILSTTDFDLIDCAILDWLIVYCNSKNEKIASMRIEGMTWIDYGQLLIDMPLLRIKSKGALTPRIKRIKESGYIKTDLKNGDKMYVSLTEKVDSLFIADLTVHQNERYRSPERTVTVHQNEPTIILSNNNTKTNTSVLPEWVNKEVWDNWIEHRKEKKKPLSSRSIDLQIKMLSGFIDQHVLIIETSIMNGWTGLFPPKEQTSSKSPFSQGKTIYQEDYE